jgi:hypothetical protein
MKHHWMNRITTAACFCLLAGGLCFAQQGGSTSQITLANQVALSARTAQSGSVTSQQAPVPGTTQSVNTLNSTVLTTGSYSQSVLSGKPLTGPLSLKEAVSRGLDYNLVDSRRCGPEGSFWEVCPGQSLRFLRSDGQYRNWPPVFGIRTEKRPSGTLK